jgi:hypothetical protein
VRCFDYAKLLAERLVNNGCQYNDRRFWSEKKATTGIKPAWTALQRAESRSFEVFCRRFQFCRML